MSEHDDLTQLARELPCDRPDDARREAVRSSLLLAARADREAPRPRYRLLGIAFAAGAAAAAVVAIVVARGGGSASAPPASLSTAHIEASRDADLEREVVHDGSGHLAELVRVHAGSVHVAAAHAGDHVQVATADARVDGDGALDLDVAADHLRAITVRTGTATLEVRDQQVVVLAAGQTWKAPVVSAQLDLVAPAPAPAAAPVPAPIPAPVTATATVPTPTHQSSPARVVERDPTHARAASETSPARAAPAHVEAAPVPAGAESPADASPAPQAVAVEPTPAPSPEPAPAPHGRSATEQHFATGYQLLQQGKPAEAARELGVAADSDGDPALAADARYFQAVALSRAGRKTEAEAALLAFLDHAPKSLRRGRAAVMLAKLIAERGDRDSARRWFESALGDADPAVVAAARAGIAGL